MSRDTRAPRAAPSATVGGLRLLDLGILVVGFGLASLGMREVWPNRPTTGALEIAAAVGVLVWLGFAASGPFLLLLSRHRRGPERQSGAEKAWLLIGGYWIVVMLLAVPAPWVLPAFALVPMLVALFTWALAPRRRPGTNPTAVPWTERAAVGVLATWPLAWLCMIILARGRGFF